MKRTALRRRNPARAAAALRRDFGDKAAWIRTLPCCCGCRRRPSEAAHAKSRGAGGTAEHLVPLARECHAEQHTRGARTFERERGVNLMELARRFEREWLAFTAGAEVR